MEKLRIVNFAATLHRNLASDDFRLQEAGDLLEGTRSSAPGVQTQEVTDEVSNHPS